MLLAMFPQRVSSHSFGPSPSVALPQGKLSNRQPIQFSGAGDLVSGFIGLIDRNRAAELISSDGLGMLAPRTAVAAGYRGGDDARETLIREGAGLVCVAMLAGLTNQLMIRVLGNQVGFYNPHGTPAKAWIGAKNLRVFSQLYDHSLSGGKTLENTREIFIERVLQGLESGDRELSIDGRLATLKTLLQHSSSTKPAETALTQMIQDLHSDKMSAADPKKYLELLKNGKIGELRTEFLNAGWGRLSVDGKKDLAQWFSQKAPGDFKVKGTMPFDQLAWSRVNELESDFPLQQRQASFLQTRLNLSLDQLHGTDPLFAKFVDQAALNHGLTSVVHLKDSHAVEGRILTSGQSRQALLKELKYFLEHYVDRAAFEVKAKSTTALTWIEQQKLIRERLFAPSAKGIKALFPQTSDGLVTGMLKAKSGYTIIPIAVAIIANGITTFLNNYITQKKYGGKVFFPGEESALRGQPNALAGNNSAHFGRIS